MIYHPFVTRVVPNMVMRRERMLPLRGEVLIGAGARVEPSGIVASAILPSSIHLLNVAEILSINNEELSGHLRVRIGDHVTKGDIVATGGRASRFFTRKCRSPARGVVSDISYGRVLIESSHTTLELEAHYRGTVVNEMSGFGVIIEVNGALIQAIWGSGKEGFGVLRMVVGDPGQPIEPEAIDVSHRSAVLVGGSSIGEEAFYRAQEMQVAGIVVGGLEARLLELASSMPFPVIVTEAMGKLAISAPVFDLLQAHEGHGASIRGVMGSRGGAVRPEVVIYLARATGEAVVESRPEFVLKEGSRVRIVGGLHFGKTGEVVGFPSYARKVETGGSFKGVEVRLESGERAFVPRANLELFG